MIVTKKHIARRTVLRGVGATLALPLLDSMIPALTALQRTAAAPTRRLGIVYVPNGMSMDFWTPSATGSTFDLTPILEPLAPFRNRLLVLSGLDAKEAWPKPGEGGGPHARAAGTFLTGIHPRKTDGPDVETGISIDQIAAGVLGKQTQLASLEVGVESTDLVGACDAGYSCAYVNTLSWRTPTTPLPLENDPRALFETLFGTSDSTDPAVVAARREKERSILDVVVADARSLQKGLGPRDRSKLDEYFDAIRDIERRLQMAEQQSARELSVVERPTSAPATYEAHATLMFDLEVLAFQSDMTRVITMMMAREISGRGYPEVGVPDSHHLLSHHQDNPEKMARLAKVNALHSKIFSGFIEKLQVTPDGDGSLLDHSLIMYGSGLSNSNLHVPENLPIALLGGSGQIKGGRHLNYGGRPVTDLYLTIMDKLGVDVDSFGDSTGRLTGLSDV